jgi:hypothetical protein
VATVSCVLHTAFASTAFFARWGVVPSTACASNAFKSCVFFRVSCASLAGTVQAFVCKQAGTVALTYV